MTVKKKNGHLRTFEITIITFLCFSSPLIPPNTMLLLQLLFEQIELKIQSNKNEEKCLVGCPISLKIQVLKKYQNPKHQEKVPEELSVLRVFIILLSTYIQLYIHNMVDNDDYSFSSAQYFHMCPSSSFSANLFSRSLSSELITLNLTIIITTIHVLLYSSGKHLNIIEKLSSPLLKSPVRI